MLFVHGFRSTAVLESNVYDELRIEVTAFPEQVGILSSKTEKRYCQEGYLEVVWTDWKKFNYSYSHLQRFVG